MGRRLFAMGAGTSCISIAALLMNRPGSPGFVASTFAMAISAIIVVMSFAAPPLIARLVPSPSCAEQPTTRADRRRADRSQR